MQVLLPPIRRPALLVLLALTLGCCLVLVGASTRRAAACSCVELDDEAALQRSDAVFRGHLVDTERLDVDSRGSSGVVALRFSVDTVYKGVVTTDQAVLTPGDSAACGYAPPPGGEFIVFAGRGGGGWIEAGGSDLVTGLCSGTRLLDADAVPAVLGVGSAPEPGGSTLGVTADDGAPTVWLVVAGATGAAAVGALAIVRRRRSRAGDQSIVK